MTTTTTPDVVFLSPEELEHLIDGDDGPLMDGASETEEFLHANADYGYDEYNGHRFDY